MGFLKLLMVHVGNKPFYFPHSTNSLSKTPIMENRFGFLSVDFEHDDPFVLTEISDVRGNQRVEFFIPLSEISFH